MAKKAMVASLTIDAINQVAIVKFWLDDDARRKPDVEATIVMRLNNEDHEFNNQIQKHYGSRVLAELGFVEQNGFEPTGGGFEPDTKPTDQ